MPKQTKELEILHAGRSGDATLQWYTTNMDDISFGSAGERLDVLGAVAAFAGAPSKTSDDYDAIERGEWAIEVPYYGIVVTTDGRVGLSEEGKRDGVTVHCFKQAALGDWRVRIQQMYEDGPYEADIRLEDLMAVALGHNWRMADDDYEYYDTHVDGSELPCNTSEKFADILFAIEGRYSDPTAIAENRRPHAARLEYPDNPLRMVIPWDFW